MFILFQEWKSFHLGFLKAYRSGAQLPWLLLRHKFFQNKSKYNGSNNNKNGVVGRWQNQCTKKKCPLKDKCWHLLREKQNQNYQCHIMSRGWLITSKTERDVSFPFSKTGHCNLANLVQNLHKQKRWKIPIRLFPRIHPVRIPVLGSNC